MLFDLFNGQYEGIDLIVELFACLFVVFCSLPIHEYAHALIATKLGDQTPRLSGRLTISPMSHLSPIGALMIFLCGFGYAKPVPVNPRNFKDSKNGMALTAIAGPISNLIMGFIAVFIANLFYTLATLLNNSDSFQTISVAISDFFSSVAYANVGLAVFNMLPIPPLDGSRILQLLIPAKYYYKFLEYERYIVIVVFILILTGILSKPLGIVTALIYTLFSFITGLPFMFI